MTEMEQHEPELEAFFAAGRSQAPVPSEALVARILADAEAELPLPAKPVTARGSFLASIWSDLGGWRGAAGMGFAGLVGLWVGYSSPTVTETASAYLPGSYGYDVADLTLTAGDFWGEG